MCSHSNTGLLITQKIETQLYPYIHNLIQEIMEQNLVNAAFKSDEPFWNCFLNVRTEFESLRNYEVKLVFPSVLKVFNTKDKPELQPKINIRELQQLTHKKEISLLAFIQALKEEAQKLQLPGNHLIYQLIKVFESDFMAEKQTWNSMLGNWNTQCACFKAAQE